MDVFFFEALLNGLLLGGVFALLSLGLNIVFGVVEVVWLCYAELVMVGMYLVYGLHAAGLPVALAGALVTLACAALGVVLHLLVIRPLLGAPPISQLLATAGVLFFLQGLVTLVMGTEHRNLGVQFAPIEVGGLFIDMQRLIGLGGALVCAAALAALLRYTRLGLTLRAMAQDREVMPLFGARASRVYLVASAIGGALAGVASCFLTLQFDVHPFVGVSFGTVTFMVCVMGGLGNLFGGFAAALLIGVIVSLGSYYMSSELAYIVAFVAFIATIMVRPQGLFAK